MLPGGLWQIEDIPIDAYRLLRRLRCFALEGFSIGRSGWPFRTTPTPTTDGASSTGPQLMALPVPREHPLAGSKPRASSRRRSLYAPAGRPVKGAQSQAAV
jgi:hypothetical protein